MQHFTRAFRRLATAGFLAAGLLAAGCATTPGPSALTEVSRVGAQNPAPHFVPVARYGRYTLVELSPTAAQQDLMLQVVDVRIPDTLHATVGDALRHVLLRSGYQLCDGGGTDTLHTLPLPAAHYHLGPLLLRDALRTLTGPAWNLYVDDEARRVCFTEIAPLAGEPQP